MERSVEQRVADIDWQVETSSWHGVLKLVQYDDVTARQFGSACAVESPQAAVQKLRKLSNNL